MAAVVASVVHRLFRWFQVLYKLSISGDQPYTNRRSLDRLSRCNAPPSPSSDFSPCWFRRRRLLLYIFYLISSVFDVDFPPVRSKRKWYWSINKSEQMKVAIFIMRSRWIFGVARQMNYGIMSFFFLFISSTSSQIEKFLLGDICISMNVFISNCYDLVLDFLFTIVLMICLRLWE